LETFRLLGEFLAERGMPIEPSSLARHRVEELVLQPLTQQEPAMDHNRYWAVQAWYRWLVEEGEIAA
jgi:hypothetical protein